MTEALAWCHRKDMDIRQVNVFDDSEVERFHKVTERAEAFERPHHSGWSLDEAKTELRRQVPTERSEVWAAYDEGTMVGGLSLCWTTSPSAGALGESTPIIGAAVSARRWSPRSSRGWRKRAGQPC
jgi:hypothetical protein